MRCLRTAVRTTISGLGFLVVSLGFLNTSAESVASSEYIWTNDSGFLSAESCEVTTTDEVPFRISMYTGSKGLSYENLRKLVRSRAVNQKIGVSNRSLVKVSESQRNVENYVHVIVTGVNEIPGLRSNVHVALRDYQGYLYKDSLRPIEGYSFQITEPLVIENSEVSLPDSKLSVTGGFLNPARQGDKYVVYRCLDNKDKKTKEFTAFDLHLNETDGAIARVGVSTEETSLFQNIRTLTVDEADLNADESIESIIKQDGATSGSSALPNQTPEKAGESTSTNETSTTENAGVISATAQQTVAEKSVSVEKIVCTEDGGSLFVRDNEMNLLRKSGTAVNLPNGSALTQISDEKIDRGNYKYIKVKFSSGEGWVASELLSANKASCASLNVKYVCTGNGGQLNIRDSSLNPAGKIANLTRVSLLGESKRSGSYNFVQVKYDKGVAWLAEEFLKDNTESCPSAALDVSSNAKGGNFVACMQKEMMDVTRFTNCNHSGKCWGSKGRSKSMYRCAKFLKVGILRCGGSRSYIACAEAKNCGPGLTANGFKKLSHKNPRNAPIGAIIVYDNRCKSTHPAGHIEIKLSESKWASDYVGHRPRSESTSCRPVKAIYYKP